MVEIISSTDGAKEDREIQICFITNLKDEKLKLGDTNFIIPLNSTRANLSKFLNSLLELETAVTFDFIVNGSLLRSSLSKSISNLSTESILEIEYFILQQPPTSKPLCNSEDWVIDIALLPPVEKNEKKDFFTLLGDGSIQQYCYDPNDSSSSLIEATTSVPSPSTVDCPVSSLSFNLRPDQHISTGVGYLTASSSGCLRTYLLGVPTISSKKVYQLTNPTDTSTPRGSLTAVAVNHDGCFAAVAFATGSFGTFRFTNIADTFLIESEENTNKKRKRDSPAVSSTPIDLTLMASAHKQQITSLQMPSLSPHRFHLMTGSLDASIKMFDFIEDGRQLASYNASKPVVALAASPLVPSCLASLHDSGVFKLWDLRLSQPDANVSELDCLDNGSSLVQRSVFSPHSFMGSCIAWHPIRPLWCASASHDGSIALIDIRTTKVPLHVINSGNDVSSLRWDGDFLLSGHSDGSVMSHRF